MPAAPRPPSMAPGSGSLIPRGIIHMVPMSSHEAHVLKGQARALGTAFGVVGAAASLHGSYLVDQSVETGPSIFGFHVTVVDRG